MSNEEEKELPTLLTDYRIRVHNFVEEILKSMKISARKVPLVYACNNTKNT